METEENTTERKQPLVVPSYVFRQRQAATGMLNRQARQQYRMAEQRGSQNEQEV